jgi:hypothetical protein
MRKLLSNKFFIFIILYLCNSLRVVNKNPNNRQEKFTSETICNDSSIYRRNLAAFSAKGHEIEMLPGLNEVLDFDHYSGYINVDSSKNSNIFYWLIESPNNSLKLPLLIWFFIIFFFFTFNY